MEFLNVRNFCGIFNIENQKYKRQPTKRFHLTVPVTYKLYNLQNVKIVSKIENGD